MTIDYAIANDDYFGILYVTVFNGDDVIINDKVRYNPRNPTQAERDEAMAEAERKGQSHVKFYTENPDMV